MSLSRHPNALLAQAQGAGCEVVEIAVAIVERAEVMEQVDRRADAVIWDVYALADVIERDSRHAVEFARAIKAKIAAWQELDAIEDEHRRAIWRDGGQEQVLGRQVVTAIHGYFGGKPAEVGR